MRLLLSTCTVLLYQLVLLVDFAQAKAKVKDTFYLIPKTQKGCLPRNVRGAFRMGADKVQLLRPVTAADGTVTFSKVLSFPGCFELTAQLEVVEKTKTESVIMYHSFKWLQALSNANVSDLDVGCSDQDEYGCGGTGNRCFYCDICDTLKRQNEKLDVPFEYDCPTQVGRTYDYFEERCINDWGTLDKDNDGTPDFMKDDKYKDYTQFLEDMKIEGYGTMRLTVYLATNASGEQADTMKHHRDSLYQKYGKSGEGLQAKEIEKKWAKVHKLYWLPKLVSENLIACVNIFFDMCKDLPIEDPRKLDAFQCLSSSRR